MDMIKCPICGEMYSSTYRASPFCEEDGDDARAIRRRPGHRVVDKGKAQSARGALIVVLILVLALVGWYLFGDNIIHRGDKPADKPENPPVSEPGEPAAPALAPGGNEDPFYQPTDEPGGETAPGGEASPGGETAPGGEASPGGETAPGGAPQSAAQPPEDENVDVSGAKLNRDDFTLGYAGEQFTIRLSGTEATPHWSIENANVASLSADGTVTAVANGNTTVHCRVGSRDLTCVVRVRNTGKTAEPASAPTVAEPIAPVAPVAPAQPATPAQPSTPSTPSSTAHVDASSLSVKTNYGTVLQRDPDTRMPDCTVRIDGDPIALTVTGTDVPVSSWTSDKTSVVEVTQDGKLNPVSRGTAHVTAKVGDAEITCIIRVR